MSRLSEEPTAGSQEAHRFASTMEGVADTSPHRVLVVDDEPNIVDVVSMALRFQGL
jgi:hypothetical protein